MQWSSSQKPVEGNPYLAKEPLSCLGRAASLLRLEDTQAPCTGAAAAPLLPLASSLVPESHHLPPGCQEHFHTKIHVMFASSLPASNLCCPSEKSTFTIGKIQNYFGALAGVVSYDNLFPLQHRLCPETQQQNFSIGLCHPYSELSLFL